MEHYVGVALALGTGLFTSVTRFDRDRALFPVMLLVIASYYNLFAVMGGGAALGAEIAIFAVFLFAAVAGFRSNLWIVVAGLAAHGVLDFFHGRLVENAGVPFWWPAFCLSFDVSAGGYLAWQLLSGSIEATDASSFGRRIRNDVNAELNAAKLAGDPSTRFHHLERAHVLGQRSTVQHVRVHIRMLMWGIRQRDAREIVGQILRVAGAATVTWLGLVPHGNTGGSNVNGFKSMAVPDDLAGRISAALPD